MRGEIGRIGKEGGVWCLVLGCLPIASDTVSANTYKDHQAPNTKHQNQSTKHQIKSEAAVTVQMELKRITINEIHDQQVIMLREVDGDRSFPIVIGIFEATSIDRRVRGQQSPRPLTHDLIAGAIEQLGGDFQDVYISELREHTYFAKLRIKKDGELTEIDCRPSDAIALAVTARVPIYVAEDVLEEALGEQ